MNVLIETLWNVKIIVHIALLKLVICINRNIVECKDIEYVFEGGRGGCINRNIVECKVV